MLSKEYIINHLLKKYQNLHLIDAWGESSLFYNPRNLLKRGVYFCTLKDRDGLNDKASYLDREGIFRMNFGISKKTFVSLFNSIPKRPVKGGIIEAEYDFTDIDVITPHPIYGWMPWVSILNPSETSLKNLEKLIDESYELCINKFNLKAESKF